MKVRLVAFDLGGKALAEKEGEIAPFTGLQLEVERPQGTKRLEFFSCAFLDRFEEVAEEIFGGVDVFDTSSGKTNIFGAPIGTA